VLALATLPLYGQSFGIMEWLITALPKTATGYNEFNAASHAIASVIMLPATFFAGMTLPLITHILIKAGTGERSIGFVYSANTLGAIAGVLLAVHVGLPLIGLKGLIVSGAVIDMALGIYLLWRWQTPELAPRALAAIGAALLLAASFSLTGLDQKQMAAGVFRANQSLKRMNDIVFYRDGKTSSIAVTRSPDKVLALRTNGKADASIDLKPGSYQFDETTMTLAAALPLMLKPETRTVANIGLGSGLTTHTLLASAAVTRVDTIEIEPAVREGAKLFQARNHRAYADPRSRIIIEDAKTYFSSQNKRYDLIVSEPSNPWVSGVSGLFSVEFYRLLKRHLAEGGLFVQWLQLYEIDLERVVSVMKALDENFSDYAIYATNFGDAVIIATPKGVLPEIPATLPDMPLLRADLKRLDIVTPQDLAMRKQGSKKLFAPWLAKSTTPANSDYHPYLDQHASRDRFMGSNSFELANLSMASLPLVEMLGARLPWTDTAVTSAPHWQQPHPAIAAMVLRDLLLQGPMTMPPAMRPGEWRTAVASATQIVDACKAPPGGDAVYALLNFAFDAIPYLRPEENARLMQAISTLACVTQLKEAERLWLKLMDAVGQREGQGMARSADALLGAGLDTTPARKRYLLALGMLGNLSINHAAEAKKIWQTLALQVYGQTRPPLLFQIMAAWSGA
jgi:spermidine synthase